MRKGEIDRDGRKIEDGRNYGGTVQTIIGVLKNDFGFKRTEFEAHAGTVRFNPERTGAKFPKLDLDDDYLFTIYETIRAALGENVSVGRWVNDDGKTESISIAAAGYMEPAGVFEWLLYRGEEVTRGYYKRSNSRRKTFVTYRECHHRREDLIFVRESQKHLDEIERYGHVLGRD